MADSFFRVQKTQDFTVMSNHHLKNPQLSLKAKGLLSFILSLPNDWDLSVRGLQKFTKEGYESLSNTLRELVNFGYVVRKQIQNEKGQFTGYYYEVHELPVTEKTEEREVESLNTIENRKGKKPDTENPFTVKSEERIAKDLDFIENRKGKKTDTENPFTENPFTENPFTENPKQLNTNNTNILNKINTKGKNTNRGSGSNKIEVNKYIEENSSSDTTTTDDIFYSVFDEKDIAFSGKYFVSKWKSMNLPGELIRLAIQDNLFRKDKLQLKHVDATLSEWLELGITTADVAAIHMKKQHDANKRAYRSGKTTSKRNAWRTGAEAGIDSMLNSQAPETIESDDDNEMDEVFDLFRDLGLNSL